MESLALGSTTVPIKPQQLGGQCENHKGLTPAAEGAVCKPQVCGDLGCELTTLGGGGMLQAPPPRLGLGVCS